MNTTRRSFLKGAAFSLAAVAAAGGMSATSNILQAGADEAMPVSNEGEWLPSFCAYCHYPCCATQVKVVDGVAREIRGDANGANKGRLCARGQNAISQLYNPYRIQAPMKRTNEEKAVDNDPGWVEINWDEALDTVGQKLKEAAAYHPDSIVMVEGFGAEESYKASPFSSSLKTNNTITSPGTLCPEHFNQLALNGQMLDRLDLEHVEYVVELGRTMGSQWCATSSSHSAHYADAVRRGVKFVAVNPVCDDAAQKGEWVPIMPGTDTAFGLGLLNVIIHEIGVYDEWWLKVRTNAPYLIDEKVEEIAGRESHKGAYVRGADGKPLVWDEQSNSAVPFDTSKGETYALLGEYEVDGAKYKTAFQILADFVADKTPEWQEEFTTVPADKVREIANDLVTHAHIGETIEINGYTFPYRPATIFMGRGMASHMLGISAARALATVNVLLGNIDVPGGMQGCYNASWNKIGTDKDGILEPIGKMNNQITAGDGLAYPPVSIDLAGYYPSCHASVPLAWKTLLDMPAYGFDYEIQVMGFAGGDPLGSSSYTATTEEAFKKVPFTFVISNHYDLPTQFADILLAEHATLEKNAFYRMARNEKEGTIETLGLMGTLVRRPVVDPTYNTMDFEDIEIELLERFGTLPQYYESINKSMSDAISPDYPKGLSEEYKLDPTQKYSYRDVIDRKICSDLGEEALSSFDTCAFYPYELPPEQSFNYWWYPENTIRQPIYYERLVRNGEDLINSLNEVGATVPNQDMDHIYSHYSGLPVWYQEGAGWDTDDEFPFKVVNWKIHYGTNCTGNLYENAVLQSVIDTFNPNVKRAWIAPSVAEEYGLSEGDTIEITSRYAGSTQGKVHISEFIHPKCIGIPGNFGRRTPYMTPIEDAGVNFNKLVSLEEATINPISLSLESSPQVAIRKL